MKLDPLETRKAFAEKLNRAMKETGLTVSDLGARMRDELKGERFNVVNLSHYRAGRAIPRPRYLLALSKAIGVPLDELLQAKQEQTDQTSADAPALRIEQLPDGGARLHLNQKLPWPIALRVIAALKECSRPGDDIAQGSDAHPDARII